MDVFIVTIFLVFVAVAIWMVRRTAGVDKRIRAFAQVYKAAKAQGRTEREALAALAGIHIPPGQKRTIERIGVSGSKYLDGVFDGRDVSAAYLIGHFIRQEYPHKYPRTLDFGRIVAKNPAPDPGQALNEKVSAILNQTK